MGGVSKNFEKDGTIYRPCSGGCGGAYTLDNFYASRKGYKPYCKTCENQKQARYNTKRPAKWHPKLDNPAYIEKKLEAQRTSNIPKFTSMFPKRRKVQEALQESKFLKYAVL